MDKIAEEKMIEKEKKEENLAVDKLIKDNPDIIKEYPILEVEYNRDGSKKEFYILASEKNIRETQIKSDENELDFNYSQNKITKSEYERQKRALEKKLKNQNLKYDNMIFELINDEDLEILKEKIREANLNDIDLKRLSESLSSIAENKITDFQNNNKEFQKNNIAYWNYKYDIIAKNYAKTRELEGYILSLIG